MIQPWMIIAGVSLIIALGTFVTRPRDLPWAEHLDRPDWLFFEPAIPVIWTVIFVCGTGSAILVWNNAPGSQLTWLLMGLYLLIEILTVAYIPVTLRTRSLTIGTVIGGLGAILGIVLTLLVWPISGWAALLLLPYLIWSPIGTYTTRQMMNLNPEAN